MRNKKQNKYSTVIFFVFHPLCILLFICTYVVCVLFFVDTQKKVWQTKIRTRADQNTLLIVHSFVLFSSFFFYFHLYDLFHSVNLFIMIVCVLPTCHTYKHHWNIFIYWLFILIANNSLYLSVHEINFNRMPVKNRNSGRCACNS